MPTSSIDTEREVAAIRDRSARWLDAVGMGDAEAAAACYSDDAAFFVPHAPPARGRAAIRALWDALLRAPNLVLRWVPSDVTVAQAGDVGYEIGTYDMAMDGPRGRIDDQGSYVVVWRRGDDGWQVAADIFNSSRPIDAHEVERTLADRLVAFLETNDVPEGLFAPEVFCDFTLPKWRLQAQGIEAVSTLRRAGHPGPGTVTRSRFDATESGFALEIEERWSHGGTEWSARELFRADVAGGRITQLSVYCTGDWDEAQRARHAREVVLLRP